MKVLEHGQHMTRVMSSENKHIALELTLFAALIMH